MGQTRNYNRNRSYNQRKTVSHRGNQGGYVYGNTARRLEVQQQLQEPARKPVEPAVRKNREKAHHMNMGYVLFLAAALIAASWILVTYVQLQAELTNLTKWNAELQSELSNRRLANDEAYNRILNSIDLEEVKRIAIGELGMVYAQEGQIYNYDNEGNDYMRKITEGAV